MQSFTYFLLLDKISLSIGREISEKVNVTEQVIIFALKNRSKRKKNDMKQFTQKVSRWSMCYTVCIN